MLTIHRVLSVRPTWDVSILNWPIIKGGSINDPQAVCVRVGVAGGLDTFWENQNLHLGKHTV